MPTINERLVIRPTDPSVDGCPLLTGLRAVVGRQGFCNVIEWVIKDRNGNPEDLTDLLDPASEDSSESGDADSGQVIFRFSDALEAQADIQQVIGWSDNPAAGIVRVQLTTAITESPGLWRFDIAVTDKTGLPSVHAEGLLSIERSNFGVTDTPYGPPTLNEIRMRLRDTLGRNDMIEGMEFDDNEILQAIILPIQEWNEALPPLQPWLTAKNFPFRFNWLNAICGYLLQTAAHWYRRNKFNGTVAGIQDENRDRDEAYDAMSKMLLDQWRAFVVTKKISINARRGFGSNGSAYY